MAGIGDWIAQILDLTQGAQGRDLNRGSTAADIADPFRGERGKYWSLLSGLLGGTPPTQNQQQLNLLLQDPGSFTLDPGAQFARDQGLQGVARNGNAMFGTTRSGNTAIELEKYATGFANDAYNKRIDQLMGISREDNRSKEAWIEQLMGVSGAKTGSPAAAADAYLGGFKNQDRNLGAGLSGGLLDDIFGLLGKGGSALSQFFKGLGGGSNFDFSSLNLGGSVGDFLKSLGFDDNGQGPGGNSIWGDQSGMYDFLKNLFTNPGNGGVFDPDAPLFNFDDPGISDSTRSLLEGLLGGGP